MRVVTKVYDDESADLFDIGTMVTKRYTFGQLVRLKTEDIIGLTVYNNKVSDIRPMKIISFPTEYEAIEYQRCYGGNIRYMLGYWWLLYEYNEIVHVDYIVYTSAGDNMTYLAESGYTQYIQAAKCFSKYEANKIASSMTKNSRTGKYWKALRVYGG